MNPSRTFTPRVRTVQLQAFIHPEQFYDRVLLVLLALSLLSIPLIHRAVIHFLVAPFQHGRLGERVKTFGPIHPGYLSLSIR